MVEPTEQTLVEMGAHYKEVLDEREREILDLRKAIITAHVLASRAEIAVHDSEFYVSEILELTLSYFEKLVDNIN